MSVSVLYVCVCVCAGLCFFQIAKDSAWTNCAVFSDPLTLSISQQHTYIHTNHHKHMKSPSRHPEALNTMFSHTHIYTHTHTQSPVQFFYALTLFSHFSLPRSQSLQSRDPQLHKNAHTVNTAEKAAEKAVNVNNLSLVQ